MPRYFFLPLAGNAQDDLKRKHHAEHLLSSDEFTVDLLRAESARGERGTKAEMAATLSELARHDSAFCERVALAYVRQPKTWLTVLHGETAQGFRARAPAEFITDHGADEDCFGPITHGSALYYIYTRSVPQWHSEVEGAKPTKRLLRWTCVIQMTRSWIALHWNNISYREEKAGEAARLDQYPYWNEVPLVVNLVHSRCGAEYRLPNLLRAVLTGAWERYEGKPGFEWTHERIRAEAHGVALSASGKKQEEIELDASGVQALTRAQAEAAVDELGADPSNIPRVERRLLHDLIHRWNPKSYQFRLEGKPAGAEPPVRFRGHVYFGTGHFQVASAAAGQFRRTGVDALAHVKCFSEYGGSTGALEFLLPFLSGV